MSSINKHRVALRSRWVALILMHVSLATAVNAEVDFNRDILPLLSDRCFNCHGPDESNRKAQLRLDTPDGEQGAYRKLAESPAIKPGDFESSQVWQRISTEDTNERMPPPGAHKKPLTAAERALFRQWILEGAQYDEFWAFIPPQRLPPPEVGDAAWQRDIIDSHVLARIEQMGMQPKAEADRRTLIRRVTFDLTGLPPSIAEIDAFLEDESPAAYDKLVERLLNTESYGEHMARHWADLVRLADSNGMHHDAYRNFSTYRSWLIRAFNDNLRFDDFITYQVAGDLYAEPSEDQLVASGFNRLHLIIDRGTALPEESHHKNVLDRVQAFGTAFLGLTLQCAQCHDHKYDPISQREFYQLYAFFNNFDGEPETDVKPEGGIQDPQITLTTAIDPATEGKSAMVMRERPTPKQTFVLIRGSYEHPGEEVRRNTPAFLPSLRKKESFYTRMDLAKWLIEPNHPLTARVAVNRFWQQFFGVGLVKTSEDFGHQGEWPSHPEMLDALAAHFIDSGWNVKELVRAIVTSKTYRQSSDANPEEFVNDPENRLLARGSRFRMDAEMIRDQILFVSGKLNQEMYGESVKPPQPPGLWEAVSMGPPYTYVADEGDAIYRRSFYTYWRRSMPPPQMTILNAPSREFCTARRERTNTPLQALLLMNEQEYFLAAKSCAQKTLQEADHEADLGLSLLYEKITSQLASEHRLQQLQQTLNDFRDLYANNPGLTEALTPEMADVEFSERARLSAWTMMAHSLLNLELVKIRR